MSKHNADSISGGIFLIGLGVLFLINWFWPGILLLLGIVNLINQWAKGNLSQGLTGLVIFGGLSFFFTFNWAWEYVFSLALIGIGLLVLINTLQNR